MNSINSQLCFTIGIPTLAIILSCLSFRSDINRVIRTIDRHINEHGADGTPSGPESSKETA